MLVVCPSTVSSSSSVDAISGRTDGRAAVARGRGGRGGRREATGRGGGKKALAPQQKTGRLQVSEAR